MSPRSTFAPCFGTPSNQRTMGSMQADLNGHLILSFLSDRLIFATYFIFERIFSIVVAFSLTLLKFKLLLPHVIYTENFIFSNKVIVSGPVRISRFHFLLGRIFLHC